MSKKVKLLGPQSPCPAAHVDNSLMVKAIGYLQPLEFWYFQQLLSCDGCLALATCTRLGHGR